MNYLESKLMNDFKNNAKIMEKLNDVKICYFDSIDDSYNFMVN